MHDNCYFDPNKLGTEVYDAAHGTYKPMPKPAPAAPAAAAPTTLDPKPFGSTK